jgi:hypothetical protein
MRKARRHGIHAHRCHLGDLDNSVVELGEVASQVTSLGSDVDKYIFLNLLFLGKRFKFKKFATILQNIQSQENIKL